MSGKKGPHHATAKTAKLPKMSHRYLTWGAVKGVKPSKKVSAATKLGHRKRALGTAVQRIRGESAAEERTMSDAQKSVMKGDLKDRLSNVLSLVSEAGAAGKKCSKDKPGSNGSSKPKNVPEADSLGLELEDDGNVALNTEHWKRLVGAAVGAVNAELATMGLLEAGGQVDLSSETAETMLEAVRQVVDDSGVLEE